MKIKNKFEEYEVSPYCWNNFYSELIPLIIVYIISNIIYLFDKYSGINCRNKKIKKIYSFIKEFLVWKYLIIFYYMNYIHLAFYSWLNIILLPFSSWNGKVCILAAVVFKFC